MQTKIANPTTYEVGSVMMMLSTNNVHLAEVHRHIDEVCGEGAINEGSMRKWCRLVKEGRTVVHDEQSRHANSSRGRFLGMPHMVATLHQIIITCFATSRNF